jgi:Acyltransferase
MSYPFPWREFGLLALDMTTGRARSMSVDAAAMWQRANSPPLVLDVDAIPATGPVALVLNHYQRRGLWIAWPAGAVTLAIAARRHCESVHWLVTGELRLAQWRNGGPVLPGSSAILGRVAAAYDLVDLPLTNRHSRMGAVRRLVGHLGRGGVIGVFPEGLRGNSTALVEPEAGFDKLLSHLRRRDFPVAPVGVFEDGERLCVRFGAARAPESADAVMRSIAELLPDHMQGRYGGSRGAVG